MVHPRWHEGFDWDEGNEGHLAESHITWWEVEEVFYGGPVWPRDRDAEPGDYFMIGKTGAGRALAIVVGINEITRRLRAITGWECDEGERTRYIK